MFSIKQYFIYKCSLGLLNVAMCSVIVRYRIYNYGLAWYRVGTKIDNFFNCTVCLIACNLALNCTMKRFIK